MLLKLTLIAVFATALAFPAAAAPAVAAVLAAWALGAAPGAGMDRAIAET